MQTFRPIDSVEALQERMTLMRKAQREFAKFTQEQVDHIFFEAAMAANKAQYSAGQNGGRGDRHGRDGRQGD